jgi:hypothetical protein
MILASAGAERGQREILVRRGHLQTSGFYERGESNQGEVEHRVVPVFPLDDLLHAEGLDPPFGLKIDTEGSELEVLKGATALLRDTEFVIAELSLRQRFRDGFEFAQFTAELARSGFYLHDILEVAETRYVDAAFKRIPG